MLRVTLVRGYANGMVKDYPFWVRNSEPAPEMAPNAPPIKVGVHAAAADWPLWELLGCAGSQPLLLHVLVRQRMGMVDWSMQAAWAGLLNSVIASLLAGRLPSTQTSVKWARLKARAMMQMEVGIEDCLHIEFEYDKSRYHLSDTVVGKIYFLLVRIKLKHMEVGPLQQQSMALLA